MMSCELNQIFLGEIASVQNYGAFVRIPGCKQQGLIHKSQVSSSRVDDASQVLTRGERVWCKVVNISDDGKVGLSMKLVNQGNGKDLDPNGVQQVLDERRRKAPLSGRDRTIKLEAVLDTICSKCGTRGHFATDCFATPDGKKYELVPEFEEAEEAPVAVEDSRIDKREKETSSVKSEKGEKLKKDNERKRDIGSKKKSKKSTKKRKRERARKETSSDSDSSENPEARENSRKRSGGNEKKSKKCKHSRSRRSD